MSAERDYVAEMRAVIDAEASGRYVPVTVARDIAEKLRHNDPALLAGWLDAQAEQFIRMTINDRDRSQRSHARYAMKRSVFASDAEAAEAGEPERMAHWLDLRFTVADGARAPLRAMTREDLLFVGDAYEARARDAKLMVAFLKAVARKVKTGVVADHFTEEQLSSMWSSLSER